jgi:nucleoside-diphosphate-sugar epimerase
MATAFVSGGSGFVGRKLIQCLAAQGHRVRALVRSAGAAEVVRQQGAEPVSGSLTDASGLAAAMRGCEVVFHSAAVMKFHRADAESERVNVQGTANMLLAARAAAVTSFVHVSAAAVVSTGGPLLDVDEHRPIPPNPFGAYARTKAKAERLVLQANGADLRTVAIRPPFVWGVGDELVLPRVLGLIRRGLFFWIDRGAYPYSTCHVRNVCEGAVAAWKRGAGGEAYFLTDGPASSFRDFPGDLLRTQGITPPERSLPRAVVWRLAQAAEALWRLPWMRGQSLLTRAELALLAPIQINDAKARRELGYTSALSKADGLAEMAREHANGSRRL